MKGVIMKMTKKEFKDLICFCILMQNNCGIIGKAPSYVIEKYKTRDEGKALLDYFNEAIFNDYIDLWQSYIEALPDDN